MTHTIKERNVILVYILGFITFGIYFLYWAIKTKQEINENFDAKIPTCWLIIIPIANIYWMYKYAEAFSLHVKKDNSVILWFLLFFLISIIAPAIVQIELNAYVRNPDKAASISKGKSDRRCANCGRLIPEDARVCPYCGKNFEETA
jgi:uncharacterized protein DUF4234/zinc ribbon protein